MAEPIYIELDSLRGYSIREKRTFIDTDQGEVTQFSYVAVRPPPEQVVAQAGSLNTLRQRIKAKPVSFAEIDGYVLEITHDPKDSDATVVNVFDLSGGLVRSGTFPQNGGKQALLEILPEEVAARGPDFADVLEALRTRPESTPE